jgi:hypothetical protein
VTAGVGACDGEDDKRVGYCEQSMAILRIRTGDGQPTIARVEVEPSTPPRACTTSSRCGPTRRYAKGQESRKIVKYMDKRFWTAPWAEKAAGGFDTNQGRERVVSAIRQLYRNGRNELEWYTDIDIIDRVPEKE